MTDDKQDDELSIELPPVLPVDMRYDFRSPSNDTGAANKTTVRGKPLDANDAVSLMGEAMSPTSDPLIGATVGNYRIKGQVGRGGFGVVYEAWDLKLDRPAALKFLRFPLDSDYVELFVKEAKVLANLSKHSGIVQIYTWGEYDRNCYFALEFLSESASKLIDANPGGLPVSKALSIAATCADGLQYAHERHVLHRDVKPQNILIDGKSGEAKLCDFGLAKLQSIGSGTQTSQLVGSPPYMAPEQIESGQLSPRTDIYALGVTLYQMLCGRLPFEGKTYSEIIQKIRQKQAVSLKSRRPDLPDSILELVIRATATNPNDRFRSAAEFAQAIRAILKNIETSGSAKLNESRNHLWRSRLTRIAAASLLAAGLAATVMTVHSLMFNQESGAGSGNWPRALAAARDDIESGNYESALTKLNDYIGQHPSDDVALFALGYAQLFSHNIDAAETSFRRVTDKTFREEGLAAVAHERGGDSARNEIIAASRVVPHAYPDVLVASLDALEGHYDRALQQLESVQLSHFWFEWQRRQYLRLLGQVHFKLGAFSDAQAAFDLLPPDDAFANGYRTLVLQKAETEERKNLDAQIDQLVDLYRKLDPQDKRDRWTSRPFAMSVEYPKSVSPLAATLGLPDLLPVGIADSVMRFDGLPIAIVDRTELNKMLDAQRLSELGSDDERLTLMQVVGARFALSITYVRPGNEDRIMVRVLDNERTTLVIQDTIPFNPTDTQGTISDQILKLLVERLRKSYPIQARLLVDDAGARLNVGRRVGVEPGMVFDLRLSSRSVPQPNARIVSTDRIGDGETIVEVQGIDINDLKGEPLYVREIASN